ncbi:LytR/AlgR family response regulator transcription factor [Pedobacter mucosus]|uniref:LytR/AlgR family response regulator transcription factor n=1 Tax=Pedobacter mucosus TaxID=2895286 RepID=UPI001EE3EE39|nr:response regulator [Pedobacter mucosus]UKT65325.1 response regulator [Pedobacter mucosus]
MSISCIAIDDDPLSLENLAEYMDKIPNMVLIKTFTEPLKALAEISISSPVDIIFMDVEMPSLSGIELASLLRQKTKHLIFTTAHARYAIDAFSVEADAYLLKPYSILNFEKTINSLYPAKDNILKTASNDDEFLIPLSKEKLIKIDLKNLVAIENRVHETILVTTTGNYTTSKDNIDGMLNTLNNHLGFISISEEIIISKQHIKSVLGNKILLSMETSYILADSHKTLFTNFIDNNSH